MWSVVHFPFALRRSRQIDEVLPGPGRERRKKLKTVARWGDLHADTARPLPAGSHVPALARRKTFAGSSSPVGGIELHRDAALIDEGIGYGIEGKPPGKRKSRHDLRARNEGMRVGIGIVPAGKVPVEGGDDGILVPLLHIVPLPLSDAGTARIGQDEPADIRENFEVPVTLDGRAHLLRTRA